MQNNRAAGRALKTMVAVATFALVACGDDGTAPQGEAVTWPHIASPVRQDKGMEARIDDLIARMSVEEKVGQVIQPEIQYITPEEVKAYHIGSILNGGGSLPNRNKHATPAEWLAMADAFYDASMDTSDGGLAIPILWGSDAVHGHNNVIGATIFPHNIGLGAMHDPALMRRIGEITAREMRVTGIDWTFAPTLAVVQNDRWGRTYESYSEDPALVRSYAGEVVYGLQGVPGTAHFLDGDHVIATAKHFVGDGGTEGGDDQGDTRVSEAELRDIHAAGYITALEAGVQTAMTSFSSWNGKKVHGSKYLITDVLKGQMGFDGPVVSDWNAHGQVKGCTNVSCARSFNAGVDILMVPQDWRGLYDNTLAQVKSGEITMARLDEAVRRILRMKLRSGLFDKSKPSERGLAGEDGVIGSAAHRDVARQAVRQSLVLLKNAAGVLPIRPDMTVLMVGDGADNIGKQAGGWTISWQGTGNQNSDFPGGQSVYDGVRAAVQAVGGKVILDPEGALDVDADIAIAVFGEEPYAEFQGDLDSLEYDPGAKRDLEMLKRLKARGLPVVSVFLSGRPMWTNPEINASDAFVAAWLPGSEGEGIADVLVADAHGTPRHDFTGRLSFSWPKTPMQDVLNPHHQGYDPLFPLGYGLDYASGDEGPGVLPEDVEGVQKGMRAELALYHGRALEPWRVYIATDGTPQIVSGPYAKLTDGEMTIRTTDKDVQEDALAITWAGGKPGQMSIDGGGALDLAPFAETGGILSFEIKLDTVPSGEVMLKMACETGCVDSVRLTDHLRALVGQDWQKVAIKLACFDADSSHLARVTTPFMLASEGAAQIDIAHVRVLPAGSAAFTCTAE
uniref:glycoside hydrolase family 3 protein n=1 Tax=Kordiimonas aestuarii TaxID=1005925 RepID=UPI0021CE1A89|nr:exo 1,3/1,4-beta-D-glucan glucohydrolase [Kordiimonas aestuarii]